MKKYIWIFWLCLIPRFLYLIFTYSTIHPETSLYWQLSESLLRFHTLGFAGSKTTGQELFYPLFLASARVLTGDSNFFVLTLQLLLSTGGCIFFFKLCRLLSQNEGVAKTGVFLYSFYPYFIRQSSALSEVSLLTMLLILSVYFYLRAGDLKNSILSGVFFALTFLTRAATLPLVTLALTAQVFRRRFLSAGLMAGSILLLTFPFFLRNYQIDGSFFLTRNGKDLLKGNCEYSRQMIPTHSLDLLDPYLDEWLKKERTDLISQDEKQVDWFFTKKALEFMKGHPLETLRQRLLNLIYLFHPRIVPFYPIQGDMKIRFDEKGRIEVENLNRRNAWGEWAHSISYGFIFLSALYGVYLRRREFKTDLILYLIVLSFASLYSLYWPATRLRAPMDFVLMFYSAFSIPSLRLLLGGRSLFINSSQATSDYPVGW